MAPDLADTLTNWDERPDRALRMSLDAICSQENAKEAFESVWFDFYHDHADQYLTNMVKLGYTGVRVGKHLIVFDPRALTRIA